jgi:hypothetical protein
VLERTIVAIKLHDMRALLPIAILSFLGVAAASAAGCSASITFPAGAVVGTVGGVPGTCSGQVYLEVPFSDCSFLTACSSGNVFALCDGTSYTECDCDNPGSGWAVCSGSDCTVGSGEGGAGSASEAGSGTTSEASAGSTSEASAGSTSEASAGSVGEASTGSTGEAGSGSSGSEGGAGSSGES